MKETPHQIRNEFLRPYRTFLAHLFASQSQKFILGSLPMVNFSQITSSFFFFSSAASRSTKGEMMKPWELFDSNKFNEIILI